MPQKLSLSSASMPQIRPRRLNTAGCDAIDEYVEQGRTIRHYETDNRPGRDICWRCPRNIAFTQEKTVPIGPAHLGKADGMGGIDRFQKHDAKGIYGIRLKSDNGDIALA
ncbi:hypothetical protein GQR58_029787 [Nymphon striatum]|nr:hypothetical protein GQR58_029787 [Nymphon striatum]